VSTSFSIEVIEQGWAAPDAGDDDLCSHGRIRLVIGGATILDGGPDAEVGISESALALLRTLDNDHTPSEPVAEQLILHGCGLIPMLGCDIGVDWDVHHDGDQVHLSNVRVDDGSNVRVDDGPGRGIAATLTRSEYEGALLAFADEATRPFTGVTKRITGEFERDEYQAFWGEYNQILGDHGAPTFAARAVFAGRASKLRRFGRFGRRVEEIWVWQEPSSDAERAIDPLLLAPRR
jgi:hypothetical protein